MSIDNEDIERAFSEEHGGVSPDLDEAGDMSKSDGLDGGGYPGCSPGVKVVVIEVENNRIIGRGRLKSADYAIGEDRLTNESEMIISLDLPPGHYDLDEQGRVTKHDGTR